MLERDDFSIPSNILSTRSGAEAVMDGVRYATFALHKANWPVGVLSASMRITLVVVVVVACVKHTVVVVNKPRLMVNTVHKPSSVC